MPVPIGPMIGIASKIAEYFGLIEGVNTKVTKLLHQAFNSAKANLEYAKNVSGQNRIDYIKQARVEFNQAVAVEENENKILALVGLAMCQDLLGETSNAHATFDKINDVVLTNAEIAKYSALYVPSIISLGARLLLPFGSLEERVMCFNAMKVNSINKRHKLL